MKKTNAKSCFVIMGYGIKNNMNLDATYKDIIKPCIIENGLIPFKINNTIDNFAYRSDEMICGTQISDKLAMCIKMADIVIADISTANENSIYELGVRHALKPFNTIILCAEENKKEWLFFDIKDIQVIKYYYKGKNVEPKSAKLLKNSLDKSIKSAINNSTPTPDSPMHSALLKKETFFECEKKQESMYDLYSKGKIALDSNNYEIALANFNKLYDYDKSEQNLLLLMLAKYKIAEEKKDTRALVDCYKFTKNNVDITKSNSEELFGRLAAICLRIFLSTNDKEYFYNALDYYRRGANCCRGNLYCARNYCALLIMVHRITKDLEVIKEYYYTARHYAKVFLDKATKPIDLCNVDDIYLYFNYYELQAIRCGTHSNYDEAICKLKMHFTNERQRKTIYNGLNIMKADLEATRQKLGFFAVEE